MESSLIYVIIGLAVFFAKVLLRSGSSMTRLPVFVLAGAAAGAGAGVIAGYPLPAASLPDWLGAVFGFTAGFILYFLDRYNWVSRSGFAYAATLVPGGILAVLLYGITYCYMLIVPVQIHTPITGLQMWTLFMAVGFASVLGFTFPERWFRRRGLLTDGEEASRE